MPDKSDLYQLLIIKWLKFCKITLAIIDVILSKPSWPNLHFTNSATGRIILKRIPDNFFNISKNNRCCVLRLLIFFSWKIRKKETLYSYWPGRWQLSIVQWFLKISRYSSWNIFLRALGEKESYGKYYFGLLNVKGNSTQLDNLLYSFF